MEGDEKIEAVQRMQDYIEKNISKHISLFRLAKVAGYSPWYSAKIFKEVLGKTPFEYIRSLRLTLATVIMRDEDAESVGAVYDSSERFIREYSKKFGEKHKCFGINTPQLKFFVSNSIRDFHNMKRNEESKKSEKLNPNTIFVQVVDKPARKLILKRAKYATDYFSYCEEVGCDDWRILVGIEDALGEPMGMWMPESLRPVGTSVYTQGVEVPIDYNGGVPKGFEIIELKPCKLMVFQSQPYEDEKFIEVILEVWEVIKKYNPEIYGYKWAEEEAPRFQFAPIGYRGYIEGRPVKSINS